MIEVISLFIYKEIVELDVFFYEAFEEEEENLRKYLPHHINGQFTWKTIQETKDQKPPADLISIRTQSQIPLSWSTEIAGILSRSTGYDHIERYLKKCEIKIPCGYLPLYCRRSVAEQAILLSMALLRKLPKQIHNFRTFKRDGLTGSECENRTLVVVGVGNIGYEIVRVGEGLNMRVIGVDIVEKYPSVSYMSIEEALPQADIIICAMNLTDENSEYFNYKLLKSTKPGLIFVNIARGELSPLDDLLRLLNEKHILGLALDVYEKESELAVTLRGGNINNKSKYAKTILSLLEYPNVILTPHNSFNTKEAVDRKAKHSIEQINYFIENGRFLWPLPI